MSTGLTPESLRPAATTALPVDGPPIPPGEGQPILDWPSAWAKLAEFTTENGAELIGDLSTSPEQDAAVPLSPDDSVEEETVVTSNEAWAAVLAFVGTPDRELVPAMCGRMQDILNRLRLCPNALPRVRQGLVLLAQATLGNVLDPFSFAPATRQEWLYPATLLEHGTPLRGRYGATWPPRHRRHRLRKSYSHRDVPWRRSRQGGSLIGIDANADLFAQDAEESLIGTRIAAGEPERNDLMLLDFCVQLGLLAPATHDDLQQGPGWSWEHTSGRRKRLDHVLMQAGPWEVLFASQALDFDIVNTCRDHVPKPRSHVGSLRPPVHVTRLSLRSLTLSSHAITRR